MRVGVRVDESGVREREWDVRVGYEKVGNESVVRNRGMKVE